MAGFRHVLDGLGIELAAGDEDLVFKLVQLCQRRRPAGRSPTTSCACSPPGRGELAMLYPGQLS